MEEVEDQALQVVPAALEREMRLIREAIALVASGGAPRVVLAGISFGETLLDPSRRLALEAGVRLVPLWRADETGADIAVERIRE
ncbi:MAG TPA: hypothetical protein VFP66_16285 [Candidatus Limnocylindrales bacterium]|nr:hypothetical protein [Candidatus Limnocylindrales bacterium]